MSNKTSIILDEIKDLLDWHQRYAKWYAEYMAHQSNQDDSNPPGNPPPPPGPTKP